MSEEAMTDFELLKEVIEYVGYKPRNYSGRGMYGVECVGVTPDESQMGFSASMVEEAMTLYGECDHNVERVINLMKRTSVDSMGYGWICYWPGVNWEGPLVDEEEDEENY